MKICHHIIDAGVGGGLQQVRHPLRLQENQTQSQYSDADCDIKRPGRQMTQEVSQTLSSNHFIIEKIIAVLTSKTSGIDFSGVLAPCRNRTWTSLSSSCEESSRLAWHSVVVSDFFSDQNNEPSATEPRPSTRAHTVLMVQMCGLVQQDGDDH